VPALPVAPHPSSGPVRFTYGIDPIRGAELRVFDVEGRRVWSHPLVLANGTVTWSGEDASGQLVAAGTYFIRLEAGPTAETRRLTLVR
jgi:hypothetical protein